MSDIKISDELFEFVAENPHVQKVHFTADGNHYLNAYEHENGKLYSKIFYDRQVGADHEAQHAPHEIVATISRNLILGIEEEVPEVGGTEMTEAPLVDGTEMQEGLKVEGLSTEEAAEKAAAEQAAIDQAGIDESKGVVEATEAAEKKAAEDAATASAENETGNHVAVD